MAPKATTGIDEAALNKGHMRKLTALRKSLGPEIADRAFGQWLKKQGKAGTAAVRDKNAEMIADALGELVKSGGLRIPRGGGYTVIRGRGRVIVRRTSET